MCSIVDEKGRDAKPKRKRALRAGDMIPPFDQGVAPADEGIEGGPLAAKSMKSRKTYKSQRQGTNAESAAGGIPKYDLAENILAEQRRLASRRRRAPRQVKEEPVRDVEKNESRTFLAEPSPHDLQELQRVVAEIVADDIARLCRRSNRDVFA